jgi:AraC family transcriptional regulator of adaptative response / DNA-3-methyladenine glycosylase II
MRVLGDPDVLLPGDVALRAGAAASGLPGEPRPLTAWAERTAPWRSYLSAHLWRAAPVRQPAARRTTSARPSIRVEDTTSKETS